MLLDGLCSHRTVIRTIELILLLAGIVYTILMLKGAFESYCSSEFFLLTLRKPWFYFRSWLSSPFYICIIMNFIVVFIAASSLLHHHHQHHHKVDNPAASVVDGSEEDIVFESSLTQLLSTLPPRDLPPTPPPMPNRHQNDLAPTGDDLSSGNHHYNDLWKDVQVQRVTFRTESLENPKENIKAIGREKQGQQETAESNAKEEEEDDGDDRNVTMEETWKAINRGENPEKKQLKKSETWPQPPQLAVPVPSGVFHCQHQEERNQEESAAKKKKKDLKKSMTFNDTVSVRCRGGLMRDPSMSLEEFNGKVEAFIEKFNNEMRLQRQESEQRFLEMINRSI